MSRKSKRLTKSSSWLNSGNALIQHLSEKCNFCVSPFCQLVQKHNTIETVHTGATWWIRLNLCFLRPTRVHNPNSKSIGSAASAQLTAESLTLQWVTRSPKIAPYHKGSGPHQIRDSLDQSEPTVQTTSRSVELFSHGWPQSVLYFTMGHSSPSPQNCPAPWFPGPTQVLNANSISIGSAIVAGLTSVTDRPTDHATRLVTIDCIYVNSTGDAV